MDSLLYPGSSFPDIPDRFTAHGVFAGKILRSYPLPKCAPVIPHFCSVYGEHLLLNEKVARQVRLGEILQCRHSTVINQCACAKSILNRLVNKRVVYCWSRTWVRREAFIINANCAC